MVVAKDKIKVAISSDFLWSFSCIPRSQQAKVMDFVTKFKANPLLPGLNYEKIHHAKDKNLRSVRIDQSYRGIVLTPDKGNVYVLLWVDSHENAYKWAENKIYSINPFTGSLQIIDVEHVEPIEASGRTQPPHFKETEEEGLFSHIPDSDLVALGVPEMLIPRVRALRTDEDVEAIEKSLPQEAYEALYLLKCGFTLEEVHKEMEREAEEKVDTSDFSAALEKEDSKRRFYVVDDELELAAILNAPLEQWRVFLHPSQRRLVERNWSGPVKVLGGAGTGKTVAAMHRAKWLAQNAYTGKNERILFTTFTRNLAADIHENMSKICPLEVMRRIEVINLDRWVSEFLRRQGYSYEIDYGRRIYELWNKAVSLAPPELDYDTAFYREEWERVVQPQAITKLDEYLRASRIGRGVKLSRKDRRAVWQVFEEYRILLDENRLREADDAMRDACDILTSKGAVLPYRSIIVDEAQDMSFQAFRLIRAMIPGERENDIFIVGDAHQRIYRHKVVMGKCGINIRGRSRKLRINYRTTEETRRWAVSLLEGKKFDDLDGGVDEQKGYKSLLHGNTPAVCHFATFKAEVAFIIEYLKNLEGAHNEVCIVARTNDLVLQYQNALQERGIETHLIKRSQAENRRAPGVRIATMHRVKGLEFDRVIIAAVNEGTVPHEGAMDQASDQVIAGESEVTERALFYVAATRAKKEVVVTSFGKPSRFLAGIVAEEGRMKAQVG